MGVLIKKINMKNKRKFQIGVMGSAADLNYSKELEQIAFDVGKEIAESGNITVYGAEKYYEKYLAIFVCFGILFENFFLSGEEAQLTNNLVINNIEKIKKMFGCGPIIVKVEDTKEGDLYWYSY